MTTRLAIGFSASVTRLPRTAFCNRADMIDCCGYPPTNAARVARRTIRGTRSSSRPDCSSTASPRLKAPSGLPRRFVPATLRSVVVGAFDWDPFAAHLPFDVTMVRQNVEAMIAEGLPCSITTRWMPPRLWSFQLPSERPASRTATQEDWDEATEDSSSPRH